MAIMAIDLMEHFIIVINLDIENSNVEYKLDSGKTVWYIKGFSVNFIASQKLNFESMRELVLNKDSEERITVEQLKFIRNKNKCTIQTKTVTN